MIRLANEGPIPGIFSSSVESAVISQNHPKIELPVIQKLIESDKDSTQK